MMFRSQPLTTESYNKFLEVRENNIEKKLKELFLSLDIRAITKTDRKSLPYNCEIKQKLVIPSYVNDGFRYDYIAREIVKEVLNKGMFKIRFYVDMNIIPHFPMGCVEYNFRYYEPFREK